MQTPRASSAALYVLLTMFAACSETAIRPALPLLELSDTSLRWEEVPVGLVEVRTVTITNAGRGNLSIDGFAVDDATSDVFEALAPEAVVLEPEGSLDLGVQFAPTAAGERTGRAVLVTNDVQRSSVSLDLAALGTDPRLSLDPPELWFDGVAPGEESRLRLGFDASGTGTVEVTGVAFEDPSSSSVFELVLPEGRGFPLRIPAGTGVNAEVVFRPVDDRTWDGRLIANHLAPNQREPVSVRLVGNRPPEPEELLYVISGGPQPTDPIGVDDDLTIEVDGVPVFVDANTVRDDHPPVAFFALTNSTIRIVATDVQACESRISGLTLHFGSTEHQPLSPAVCVNGCDPTDPCYDPSFTGPWPAVFVDRSYAITIP